MSLTEAPWTAPPMIAARKMMTPGVLTHEKEVVLALGEVLIWTVELN